MTLCCCRYGLFVIAGCCIGCLGGGGFIIETLSPFATPLAHSPEPGGRRGWLGGFAGAADLAETEDTESIAALALPVVGPAEGGPPTTDPAPPMPLPIPFGLLLMLHAPALPPLLAYGFETLPVPVPVPIPVPVLLPLPLPVGGLGLLPAAYAYGLDTCALDGLCCRGG